MAEIETLLGTIRQSKKSEIKIRQRHMHGLTLIDIRSFYYDRKSGEQLPTKKGISIPADRIAALMKILSTIPGLPPQVAALAEGPAILEAIEDEDDRSAGSSPEDSGTDTGEWDPN